MGFQSGDVIEKVGMRQMTTPAEVMARLPHESAANGDQFRFDGIDSGVGSISGKFFPLVAPGPEMSARLVARIRSRHAEEWLPAIRARTRNWADDCVRAKLPPSVYGLHVQRIASKANDERLPVRFSRRTEAVVEITDAKRLADMVCQVQTQVALPGLVTFSHWRTPERRRFLAYKRLINNKRPVA
jgi:hypothetical protein